MKMDLLLLKNAWLLNALLLGIKKAISTRCMLMPEYLSLKLTR